ncbi:GtrA family protein [Sneathiella sp.]|uniref:GtrA family protein n=1 Tax=Sneathiella sp. TaxID=1964365 RepID=UPI00356993D7
MTLKPLHRLQIVELWRYYQAGIVNTIFGLAIYSLLVWLGFNIYAAQILSHLCGVLFNYVTYSRFVFPNSLPARMRFLLAYVVNYLVSLVTMAVLDQFLESPYVLGIVTVLIASMINYIVLKKFVFQKRSDA